MGGRTNGTLVLISEKYLRDFGGLVPQYPLSLYNIILIFF